MNRYLAIHYSCEVSRDAAQNTANHQAMVDRLNAVGAEDGWSGAKVIFFSTDEHQTLVGIEPGPSPLTLDYLRRMKEAGKDTPTEPPRPVPVAIEGRLL